MGFLRDAIGRVVDAFRSLGRSADDAAESAKQFGEATEKGYRDTGPATERHLRRLMRRWGMGSVFTKKITPYRKQRIREFLAFLRPEQREIVYRKRWNKGVTL